MALYLNDMWILKPNRRLRFSCRNGNRLIRIQVEDPNKRKDIHPPRLFRSFSHKSSLYGGSRGCAGSPESRGLRMFPLVALRYKEWRVGPSPREERSGRNYLRSNTQTTPNVIERGQVIGHPKRPLFPHKTAISQKRAHPTVLTHGMLQGVKKGQFYEESLL